MYIVEFNHVYKKFSKGEKFGSLRDAIPGFFRLLTANNNNDLKKQDFWALRDINFGIKNGEVLGIIGPNGAGKSTILKLLSRIMAPNKGMIQVRGKISALIEVTAGFHPELTGRENIYLNGTIMGMTKKEIDRKFDSIVDFSGLEEFIDTPVKRYSTGMFSRLGFSVAANMEPDIFLVDEVLSVGDVAFQEKCAEKMRRLLNSGSTIILVSHNISLVRSLCKRSILLNKGEIMKEGATDKVLPYYQNLVHESSRKELERKIDSSTNTVRINTERNVEIVEVYAHSKDFKRKDEFKVCESISITMRYKAKSSISRPVFCLDIIRGDGVLCCRLNSDRDNFCVEHIQGEGEIRVVLRDINLAAGLYLIAGAIWDGDMIHPYDFSKKEVFKIYSEKAYELVDGSVFLPQATWELIG